MVAEKLKYLNEQKGKLVNSISKEILTYTPAYNDDLVIKRLEERLARVKSEIRELEGQLSV